MIKDNIDYFDFLQEIGMTKEQIDAAATDAPYVKTPKEWSSTTFLGESRISGVGVFARNEQKPGDVISVVMVKDNTFTTVGRYLNHAQFPNCVPMPDEKTGWVMLHAISHIRVGQELTLNYRNVKQIHDLL